MQISDMPEEDKVAMHDTLLQWKKDGNEKPLLPLDVDLDGDGKPDAYGLDENDELVFVSGVSLEDTVFESTGVEEASE